MSAVGQCQTFYRNFAERLLSNANQSFEQGLLKNRELNVGSSRKQPLDLEVHQCLGAARTGRSLPPVFLHDCLKSGIVPDRIQGGAW